MHVAGDVGLLADTILSNPKLYQLIEPPLNRILEDARDVKAQREARQKELQNSLAFVLEDKVSVSFT